MCSGPFSLDQGTMKNTERAAYLAKRGSVAEAYQLLASASETGDGDAAQMLAHWRMAGDLIRRDIGEARRLFGIAADNGNQECEAYYVALLANGAGGTARKWQEALFRLQDSSDRDAQAQSSLIAKMELDSVGNPRNVAKPNELRTSPRIWEVREFLTPDECEYLQELAAPLLRPAVVIHPSTGALIEDPIRRSSSVAFPFICENPVLHAINRRIAAVTSTRYEQGEPTQILSYGLSQEYKRHSDAIAGEANQRALTLLVYLNDQYSGGDTYFTEIDFGFKGNVGDALIFSNVGPNGRPDLSAFHAGTPVTYGRKVILSKWIRQEPLCLDGPPNRPF